MLPSRANGEVPGGRAAVGSASAAVDSRRSPSPRRPQPCPAPPLAPTGHLGVKEEANGGGRCLSPPPHRPREPRTRLIPLLLHRVARCRKRLVSIHEVSPFLQFNLYIRRGYRPCHITAAEALGSVFLYFHNESVNILSHVCFAVLFMCLALWPPIPPLFAGVYETVSETDLPGGGAGVALGGSPSTGESAVFGPLGAPAFDPLRQTRAQGTAREQRRPEGRQGMVDPAATVAGNRAHAFLRSGQQDGPRGGYVGVSRALTRLSEMLRETVVALLDALSGGQRHAENGRERASDPVYQTLVPPALALSATFWLSCVYHTFMPCCRTRRGYLQLLQCDVLGVLISITGSAWVYVFRGNPCLSPSVLAAAIVIMTVSSLCALYLLLLAPLDFSFHGFIVGALGLCVDAVAALLLNVWEWLKGDEPAVEGGTEEAVLRCLMDGRCRFRRRILSLFRGDTRACASLSDGKQAVVGVPELMQGGGGGGGDNGWRGAKDDVGRLPAAVSATSQDSAKPTATSRFRAAVFLMHCLMHFVCYLVIIVPKQSGSGSPSFRWLFAWWGSDLSAASVGAVSGYTQGVYYHGMAYFWLFLGGALNVSRQPERLLWAMTRRARAFERRRMEFHGEAVVEEERRWRRAEEGGDGRQPEGTMLNSLLRIAFPFLPRDWSSQHLKEHVLFWWPSAFCYGFTTYILSNRELDFVGNSHNLWHITAGLGALSMLAGAYYDVVEWEMLSLSRC